MQTVELPTDNPLAGETLNFEIGTTVVLDRSHLQDLLNVLSGKGYQLWGPTMRDGAIVYDEIDSAKDLPEGWTDEQEGGTYRLKRRDDKMLFGFASSPQSWKPLLHVPTLRLWKAKREGNNFKVQPEEEEIPKRAFIGVRSCDLHAIAIQDRVFLGGPYVDPAYKKRRENLFIVAVNCGKASATCFCTSVGSGPRATSGFDLALTEVLDHDNHYFVVEVGSERGVEVLKETPCKEASSFEQGLATEIIENTAAHMGRHLETDGLKELLYNNHDNPRWENVAARCLSCGNCTQVCPTCFCVAVEDVTDLTGDTAERWRRWDSCFTVDFSYLHGGSVRQSPKARYRQWMTHKLASWQDQFGTMGCVGCGRCITWCPVGIDITKEAAAIREPGVGK